jgi:hypothetical protein
MWDAIKAAKRREEEEEEDAANASSAPSQSTRPLFEIKADDLTR